jgi:diguanylate cyclase (GGDEF)-like protein/PAS domain S-box-containing protein
MPAEERDQTFHALKSLFENNPDASYELDIKGHFIHVNEAVVKITGFSRYELLQMSFFPLINHDDLDRMKLYLEEVIQGRKLNFELTIIHKNGHDIELSVTAVPVIINGKTDGIIGFAKDITERKRTEKELSQAKQHLQKIFDSVEICVWSLHYGPEIKLDISPACETIYGYTQQDFILNPQLWKQVIHPEDLPQVEVRQQELLEGKSLRHEYRIIDSNQRINWVDDTTHPVIDEFGELTHLNGVIRDITQLKRAEEKLHYMAFHDALTGLPNRYFLDHYFQQQLAAKSKNKVTAVLFIDLDRFKIINDSLGHDYGDLLLKKVSERLKGCIRSTDILARYGGDEFIILLQDASEEEAKSIALHILDGFAESIVINHHEIFTSPSIGISLCPMDGEGLEELIHYADAAMYHAKDKGKNNFQFYNSFLDNEARKKMLIENGLRKAIENDEFYLCYQPQIDLKAGKIIGVEALLRWEHPQFGVISPADFIPVAEDTGLIIQIGHWVLKTACMQSKAWQDVGLPPIVVGVNLSARQFNQSDLVETISEVLQETGLAPQYLEVEITERMTMDVNRTISTLQELKKLGIGVSIDDFGIGYSSLHYLKRFPIDKLKIDKSFVRDCMINSNDSTIVTTIIAMSHQLKFNVIAEGVETKEQLLFLQQHGCDEAQGFFFSIPLSKIEFERNCEKIEAEFMPVS